MIAKSKKNKTKIQNCRSIFVYSAKNKNRRGDQLLPKESSICGKKSRQLCLGATLHDRAIVS